MALVETYTATSCGDAGVTFEVLRWIVDEIPISHLVAVRRNESNMRFICAKVNRSAVNRTEAAEAHMCVDSGFSADQMEQCIEQWEA